MKIREKRPLFIVAGAIILMVVVLLFGGLRVHGLIVESFHNIDSIDNTLQASSGLLRTQLDEETGIRGYAATGNTVFLEPFVAARIDFPKRAADLQTRLHELRDTNAGNALADLVIAHARWEKLVANSVLRNTPSRLRVARYSLQVQYEGKLLVDRIRSDFDDIDNVLTRNRRAIIASTRRSIDTIAVFVFGSILSFMAIGGFVVRHQFLLSRRLESVRIRAREIQSELNTKHHIAEVLQEALSQRPLPALPSVRFSATYVPASEQSKVGGDWYDAIELSHNRVLFVIGDVAGHGIEAAVGMSRARQAFIGSALKNPDPAHVLASVNAELNAQGSPMVTAVCGVADSDRYEFIYATAGHPPPLLMEPGHKPRLLQCGGLPLGVLPHAEYHTKVVQTVPGAMVVLYTDGAVEHSHDVLSGEAQLIQAAEHCRDNENVDPATAMHEAIFSGRAAGDDVAILTMGFTSELKTGMTISAEHLRNSFSGRISRKSSPSDPSRPHTPGSLYRLRAA